MLCCISSYFNYHVACFDLAYLWSCVVSSTHPFWEMRRPVNMYCDLDIVILTYHILTSVQLMSYALRVLIHINQSSVGIKSKTSKSIYIVVSLLL